MIPKSLISKLTICLLLVAMPVFNLMSAQDVHAFPKGLLFPVVGGGSFSNDFDAYRSLNGVHRATDIFAPKHTPVVAAVDGTIEWIVYPQPNWGWGVSIEDPEGYSYWYIHLNNDNPGTDDAAGGPMKAYAPDIPNGAKVKKGQLIGYLGDSGNAENTPAHLHFEIINNNANEERLNPYPYLMEAVIPTSINRDHPKVSASEILPYGPQINANVNISVGKFGAPLAEAIVTGTGAGYAPHIRIADRNNNEIGGFYAYNPAQYTAGVDVATGDVDGDGVDEIISGTVRGAPHVRVFELDGTEIASFYAYSPTFTGGVRVSTVDIDNDGKAEVLTGVGSGGSPHVRVLDMNGVEKLGFMAYAQSFTGGVDVASGDVSGDVGQEIVTTPGPGGSAHLRMFNSSGVALGAGFNAYEAYTGYTGGARVDVGNVALAAGTAKQEIIVSPSLNGGPHYRILNADGTVVKEGYSYEVWWSGNYDVAIGDGSAFMSTGGNRRSSIRVLVGQQ